MLATTLLLTVVLLLCVVAKFVNLREVFGIKQ